MKLLYICSFLLLSASCSLHYKLIVYVLTTHALSPLVGSNYYYYIYVIFIYPNNTSLLVKTKSLHTIITQLYYSQRSGMTILNNRTIYQLTTWRFIIETAKVTQPRHAKIFKKYIINTILIFWFYFD